LSKTFEKPAICVSRRPAQIVSFDAVKTHCEEQNWHRNWHTVRAGKNELLRSGSSSSGVRQATSRASAWQLRATSNALQAFALQLSAPV